MATWPTRTGSSGLRRTVLGAPLMLALALPFATSDGLVGQDERPFFVSGIVVGNLTQRPVEAAEVTLVGPDLAVLATTLSGVEGLWGVSGDHLAEVVQVHVAAPGFLPWASEGPVLRRGLRAELRRPGDPTPLEPVDLSDEAILGRCGDLATPETAVLAGVVVAADSGAGLGGVEVVADWGSAEPPRLVVGAPAQLSYQTTISGPDGAYLFCALPPDRALTLWLRGGDPAVGAVEVTLEAGSVRAVQLEVGAGGG